MQQNDPLVIRQNRTIGLLKKKVDRDKTILDLGTFNELSKKMQDLGYGVINTEGEDLDLFPDIVKKHKTDVVTAFEILEHLVSPLPVLRAIESPLLIATVPLKLWFSNAYRSKTDPWDRHYHEFEDWQFDWLLEKAGWNIIKTEKWISKPKIINGFRPFLRTFTPRYYAVIAERKE